MFRHSNTLCGELTYELMRHCEDKIASNRSAAASLLYLMIDNNVKEMGNFLRMKLQATVSISKMVGEAIDQECRPHKDTPVCSIL